MFAAVIAGFFVYGVITAILVLWEFFFWQKRQTLWLIVNSPEELYEVEKLLYFLKERLPGKVNLTIINPAAKGEGLERLTAFFPQAQITSEFPADLKKKNYLIFF